MYQTSQLLTTTTSKLSVNLKTTPTLHTWLLPCSLPAIFHCINPIATSTSTNSRRQRQRLSTCIANSFENKELEHLRRGWAPVNFQCLRVSRHFLCIWNCVPVERERDLANCQSQGNEEHRLELFSLCGKECSLFSFLCFAPFVSSLSALKFINGIN